VRRQAVDSSSLESVGYDVSTHVLEIAFRNGGVYQYEDVPPEVFEDLMAADSLGRFFTARIRPRYSYHRVGTR